MPDAPLASGQGAARALGVRDLRGEDDGAGVEALGLREVGEVPQRLLCLAHVVAPHRVVAPVVGDPGLPGVGPLDREIVQRLAPMRWHAASLPVPRQPEVEQDEHPARAVDLTEVHIEHRARVARRAVR